MSKVKILTVIGARPQFIKVAAVSRILRKHFQEVLLHTGQHYDDEMSESFFRELKIPRPDYNLGVGSDTPSRQIASMLLKMEPVVLKEKPDIVFVYGDTNSTLAGALMAASRRIALAHVEAGLRSFRRDMPEEINRVLTDHLSTFLFCPTENAVKNLKNEGITKGVYNVGDVMYDALFFYISQAKENSTILTKFGIKNKSYYLATIHREENADSRERLKEIVFIFSLLDLPVIFPIHPRTQKALRKFRINIKHPQIRFIKPVSYFDMLMLELNARAILTDSGGVQKEAYFLNVPCLTLRQETEWPETVNNGANKLVGIEKNKILNAIIELEKKNVQHIVRKNLFGNGKACCNILEILIKVLKDRKV